MMVVGGNLGYEKMYTRENCLLIHQMWQEDMPSDVRTILDNPPNTNFGIYDVTKGVSDGYHDNKILSSFEKHIITKIKQDKNFVPRVMKWFEEKLNLLEIVWKDGRPLKTRKQLIDFYYLMVAASAGLDVAYFTPKIKGPSNEDKKLAMRMRKRSESFTSLNNKILVKSLTRFYPRLGKYSKYLSIEELKSDKIPKIIILKERYEHYIYFRHKIFTGISFDSFVKKFHLDVKKEKMSNKITRYKEKSFTREHCLLIIQMWEDQLTKDVKKFIGWSAPPTIFDVNRGVASLYFTEDYGKDWEKQIAFDMRKDKNFINNFMLWYSKELNFFESLAKEQMVLNSASELIAYYKRAAKAWVGQDLAFILPDMKDASKDDKKIALEMRKRSESFTRGLDSVVIRSLQKLYPKFGRYSKYISLEELKGKEKVTRTELKKRHKHYIYFKYQIFTNIKFEDFLNSNNLLVKGEETKLSPEITGQIAMRGRVSGRVKLIMKNGDFKQVKTGDILVAPMTNPEYLSSISKAAAIVTDEGGITCHAAIVARELKKPCIIGTRTGTKILKTGDYVEVDATKGKGIVRMITKNAVNQTTKKEPKRTVTPYSQKSKTKIRPELILWFEDLRKEDIPTVGGKGANLGELFNHFSIPNGFCITVNSYKRFIEKNGIDREIRSLLGTLDVNKNDQLDTVSKKIRDLILGKPFPKDLEKLIKENYSILKNKKVAIRSSATAEDLPTASFAGQQDTYLNIRGEKSVFNAVQRCWASLFTARAIYYREKNRFEHEDVLISVVVQEMIDADYAGVMFTIDPVNKKYILIETVRGLGESLVSGQVTPNSYFVHKRDEKIIEKVENFDFNEKLVHKVAALGRKIEIHYKFPMDVEYAIRNNKIYVLQARPITTL